MVQVVENWMLKSYQAMSICSVWICHLFSQSNLLIRLYLAKPSTIHLLRSLTVAALATNSFNSFLLVHAIKASQAGGRSRAPKNHTNSALFRILSQQIPQDESHPQVFAS